MIFVDRSRVPVPAILNSPKAEEARHKAEEFFSRPKSSRLQERHEFNRNIWLNAGEALRVLFYGKCAFCETHAALEVDHFRPKFEASGLKKEARFDGYWWLAYEWENLYSMCNNCIRNKRNRFPVVGSRARLQTYGTELAREKALLLDPCADNPQNYLAFQVTGFVKSRPMSRVEQRRFSGYNRGEYTIEILGLNRTDLVQGRKELAKEMLQYLRNASTDSSLKSSTRLWLRDMLDPARQFAGMRRQLITEWSARLYRHLLPTRRNALAGLLRDFAPELTDFRKDVSDPKVASAKAVLKAPHKVKLPLSTQREGYLDCIEIKNFKSIQHLNIAIPPGNSTKVGWKVLLGENGTGKSSVLHGVALALMGERYVKRVLRLKPDRILRRLSGGRLTKDGYVRLRFTQSSEPIEMHFDRKRFTWKHARWAPVTFLRAYGATRLLPRTGRGITKSHVSQKSVHNLFNPQVPVIDADVFFAGLKSKRLFGSAALSLKDLLRISMRARLSRLKGRVVVVLNGIPMHLNEFSDGYQSIVVLATDIMAGVMGTVHDLSLATGIVLLDEIDAHLHPRWKMEIVRRLRNTFPRIQFLVTTHEPLCLCGLEDNEVTVLRREGRQVTMLDNLPSPAGLRVDQLLTSNLFGLHSTIDPDLDKKFGAYYALLAKDSAQLSNEDKQYRDQLKLELASAGTLGHTRRDQLAYEVIDQYLAKELQTPRAEREVLREETKRRVAEIWSETGSNPERQS